MHRWKHGFLSKIKKYKTHLKREAGITLVELLAALSILSVVILLAGSIHMFGQRQFLSQSESASQANNISYAMTVLSSDLRKHTSKNLVIEENTIEFAGGPTYRLIGDELQKDGEVIADSIKSLEANRDGTGTHGVNIKITSRSEHSKDKVYETTITFRGVANEASKTDNK